MNRWQTKKLGELVLRTEQRDPTQRPDEEFVYVDISAVDNAAKEIHDAPRVLGAVAPSRARKVMRAGDVIVATVRPALNAVALVPASLDDQICSTGFCVLRTSKHLNNRYLFYFSQSPEFVEHLVNLVRGASYPAVTENDVKETLLPLPPITEQERIVGILDEATALRRLRTRADQRSSDLTTAFFLEKFGSPADNPKGWPLVNLGDVVEFFGGGTPSRENPDFFKGAIPWATSKDMKEEYIDDAEEHITESAIAHSATQLVPAGSVLMVVKSKILMHSLPVAIATVPICFGQDLKGLVCGDQVLPEFMAASLRAQKAAILVQARGANTEGLTLEMLRAVRITLPPLSIQHDFADGVAQIRALKTGQSASRKRLDDLFQSLLHCAFQGEL